MPSSMAELTGRIVRPGDPEYPQASAGWNLLYAHQPAVIVFAQQTDDVVNALSWALQNNVEVRVRSGRHGLEGWSNVDNGVVIDVSELKSATIDAAAGTATVGAGLNQSETVSTLGAAGFAAPTGTEGTVGLVGATLGGGFGLLTRNFGMASDNLLAAEIVVADGDGVRTVIADEQTNPDLLWALRGAGNGQFGVVTAMTYRIHPLTRTVYITASWPGLGDLRAVFEAWQRIAPHTDHRLTSQLEIGQEAIEFIGVLASGSKAEAAELMAPMLATGSPAVTMTEASWAQTYAGFQIPTDDEPANWKFLSQFVSEPFPAEAIDLIGTFMATAPAPGCNYFTNAFGGAVAGSEPAGGSAFAHRGALFYAEPGAGWGTRGASAPTDTLTAACRAWVTDFAEALQPFVNGAYANVPNADAPDWAHDYWGANVARLRAIKAAYDPRNVFCFEQSLPPAPS